MIENDYIDGEGIKAQIEKCDSYVHNTLTRLFTESLQDILFINSKKETLAKTKNIIRYSKLRGFEALVSKLEDNRMWIRINGREYLLNDYGIRIKTSDRDPEVPVDFDWKTKYVDADKYTDNSKIPISMSWLLD